MKTLLGVAAAVLLTAGPGAAADRALLVANATYDAGGPVAGAARLADAAAALRAAGFEVTVSRDLDTPALRRALSQLLAGLGPDDRLVIGLSGRFAQSARGTWFLARDAAARPDLATVGAGGVALDVVAEIAAMAPGSAVILLGVEGREGGFGPGLARGLGPFEPPQGVTLFAGAPDDVAAFAGGDLARPGTSLSALAAAHPELAASGFLPAHGALVPAAGGGPPPDLGEAADWQAAQAAGTEDAYRAYLAAHPAGAHAGQAQAALQAILNDPARLAQAAEDALALSRDDRRKVQRDLSLLGYDPRGIDGIFGPGTRRALHDWQAANGLDATGYLTATVRAQLSGQADRRAAQLEAEAQARQAAEEQADRAYWSQTGAKGDAPGLRAYLKRYPDGLYADVAQARLDAIEQGQADHAARQERAAWEQARAADTVAAYRDYLRAYPDGAFADAARSRIAQLGDRPDDEAARAAEAALNLNLFSRRLVEQRLDGLKLDPGPVDGIFDERTRRAIRRFQRARNLPATGYIDQETMVRLLAEVFVPGH